MSSKRECLGILTLQKFEVWGFLIYIPWVCHMGSSWPEYKLFCSSPPSLGQSRPRSSVSLRVCLLNAEEGYGQWLSHGVECCLFLHWLTRWLGQLTSPSEVSVPLCIMDNFHFTSFHGNKCVYLWVFFETRMERRVGKAQNHFQFYYCCTNDTHGIVHQG